jgi:hypothetical protein
MGFKRRIVAIPSGRFGKTYRSQWRYAASSGNSLPTFLDNISVLLTLRQAIDVLIGCPTTSARNYHYSLHKNPEERRSRHVILHHNIRRHSHQTDGSPTSVTLLQLLRKQTNISTPIYAAHDFPHSADLWHQPRFANVTCSWSWSLCGINFVIL